MEEQVCQLSGETVEACTYRCPTCPQYFVPCPTVAEIRRLSELIRNRWPQKRLDDDEHREAAEIPLVRRASDRMARKPDNGD